MRILLRLLAFAVLPAGPLLAQNPPPAASPPDVAPPAMLPASPKANAPDPFSIGNAQLRFEFTQTGDEVSFDKLMKLTGGVHSFVVDTPPGRLWEVGLRQLPVPQGAGVWPVVAKVRPSDCHGKVSRTTFTVGATTRLTIRWDDCRPVAGDPSNTFNLLLKIEIKAGSPIALWNFQVENHLPGWALYYVSLLHGFASEPQHTYLVVPATGRLIRDPQSSMAPNPTGSAGYGPPFTNWQHFQLFPYYTADGHGVYYATHDGKATYAKFTNLFGYGNRYEVQTAYYPENSSVSTVGTTYATPYPIAFGVFGGDWYDAAQIYRSWAENHAILEKGKLISRADVPQWFKDLTVTSFGYLPQPLTDPAAVANYVNDWVDVRSYQGLQGEDYYLFQEPWYEPSSLGYYQPLPGIDALFLALRNQGIYVGGRTLSFTYSQTAPPSPCGSAQANVATLVNGTYDPFDPTGGYHVNPFTTFAQCYLEDFVLNRLLPTHAVHFFYDNPYFTDVSYDPSHGNPLGQGGSWIYDRVATIMEQVRTVARTVEPRFVTTHEASAETYIRVSDSTGSGYTFFPPFFVSPGNAADETRIPLQSTLYHDYAILAAANEIADYYSLAGVFTNFEDLNFALAYGFDEGRQLNTVEPFLPVGFANHELLDPASPLGTTQPTLAQAIVDYTVFLNAVIQVKKSAYGKKYLTYGQRLRSLALPTLGTVTKTFNPIFAGGATYTITASEVLHSVWKANDGTGDVGIVLTNYNPSPVTFTLGFDSSTFGLDPLATHTLTLLDPAGGTLIQTFAGSFSIPITIPAKSVRVYEVD
ncbi:MAG TPA: DUF6259 domain-containing protein [Planctomycetota bacterium]|jgi:hypothetical protein|nr:DUF6259 domain-containing protein [Planctomycetota bacterium]